MSVAIDRVFPFIQRCDGLLIPPFDKIVDGCPTEVESVIALDLPFEVPGSEEWAIRTMKISYMPELGRMVETSELRFISTGGGWKLVRSIPLLIIE
jgi:hypothetical protein